MTPNQKSPRDLAVDAAIALLAETWPACFSVFEQRRRPLKIGIHSQIIAALDGAITPSELRRTLGYYTSNRWYLRATVAGAARIDLAGNPAGTICAEEAAAAVTRLASYKKKPRATSVPAPSPSPPTPPPLPSPPSSPPPHRRPRASVSPICGVRSSCVKLGKRPLRALKGVKS
jgi:ProP effector